MTPPNPPQMLGACRAPGCQEPATTTAVSEMLGEIEVCAPHAAELAGEPVAHEAPPTTAVVVRGECTRCGEHRPLAADGGLCAACLAEVEREGTGGPG